MADQMGFN